MGAAICFLWLVVLLLGSWGRSLAGQFFWALLGSHLVGQLYGMGVALLETGWLLAGVPQAAGPYGLITLQGSLGLFLGGSASQNITQRAPVREHQLEKVPLAKKRPETNPDSRGGGIGSNSLGEEGELRACFEVAHTTASDGRLVRRGQAWGGWSTEACGRVALC